MFISEPKRYASIRYVGELLDENLESGVREILNMNFPCALDFTSAQRKIIYTRGYQYMYSYILCDTACVNMERISLTKPHHSIVIR